MPETGTSNHVYTVSEITRNIRAILEDAFGAVWVEGEVSNFTRHSSGHMYFSIKDETSILSCVIFRNANQHLKFTMESGIRVICFGRVGVYDKRGQYQLYVDKVEPKGLGALQLAFEQLKEKLRKEGLFDEAKKKRIPFLPSKIGVVTSPTGAAIQDILRVTRERFQNIDLIISPVRVQGEGSEKEIAQAIRDFNVFGQVDVIIVGRGGGSLEDLWAFNEEIVARAIYDSKIPIISAVGHEVDTTIADFVADLRAPTPTAAAEYVIPRKEDLIGSIEDAKERLKNALFGMLQMHQTRLRHLCESYVFKQPMAVIEQHAQRLDDLLKGVALRMGHIITVSEGLVRNLAGKLESLSPFAVLERGYSITTKVVAGAVLKDADSVSPGDAVKTRLRNGAFISRVESIERSDSDGRTKI